MTRPTLIVPPRPQDGHKGTFGRVLVVGGCAMAAPRMLGAPALAARGALRAGAGLVTIAAPAPLLDAVLGLCPSATGVALPCDATGALVPHECVALLDASGALARADAVVVGPGLGVSDGAQALVLRAVQQQLAPVVVDADALTLLSRLPDVSRDLKAPCVLTPHPGEYQRLAAALGLEESPRTPEARARCADALAQRLGCIVVLKGAGTVVSDGLSHWTCPRGHACLATAGTGDVLSGVLGSLLAQHVAQTTPPEVAHAAPDLRALAAQRLRERASTLAPPSDEPQRTASPREIGVLRGVVQAGVMAHAMAGEAWALEHRTRAGLLATELGDLVSAAIETLREQGEG